MNPSVNDHVNYARFAYTGMINAGVSDYAPEFIITNGFIYLELDIMCKEDVDNVDMRSILTIGEKKFIHEKHVINESIQELIYLLKIDAFDLLAHGKEQDDIILVKDFD